jgi:hypothetical protein
VQFFFLVAKFNISRINPLNAKLNPICHLLALLGTHHILNFLKKNNAIYENGTDSVPKRQYIKLRSRGITQKKEYNIQNKAEV